MCLYYAAADGKPQTGAHPVPLLAVFYLIKTVKHLLVKLGGNTRAFIGDTDDDIMAVGAGFNGNAGAFIRVLHRILHQIGEHLANTGIISHHRRQTTGNVNLKAVFCRQAIQSTSYRADHLRKTVWCLLHLQCSRLQAGHHQQVFHQPVERISVLIYGLQEVAPGLLIKIHIRLQQAVCRPLDYRQRGAQLMRHVSQKFSPQRVQFSESPGAGSFFIKLGIAHRNGYLAADRRQQTYLLRVKAALGAADNTDNADALADNGQRYTGI